MKKNRNGQLTHIPRLLFLMMILLCLAVQGFAEETETEFNEETILILEEIDDILETTVITASRTGTTLGKSTRSIALITREDMETAQKYHIPGMTDQVSGVFTRSTGGPGQLTHILIRGVSDDYTQMQYNGIPLKDPSDMLGSLYFSYTNFYSGLNIDNIEILKGVNSTLYGSQAVGGVVNIAPERWTDGSFYESRSEFGEYDTLIKHEHVSFGNNKGYVNVSAHLVDTDGDDNGGEHDFYYQNKGFFANAGTKIGNNMTLEFHAIHYDAKAPMTSISEMDDNNVVIPNTAHPTQKRRYRLNQAALLFSHYLFSSWDYIFKVAYTESLLLSDYSEFEPEDDIYYTNYGKNSGDTLFVELQNNFYPTEWLTLVAGINYEQSRKHMESLYGHELELDDRFSNDVWDMFALSKTSFFDKTLMLDAGVRYSDHDEFDPEVSWEFSGVYIFEKTDTRIRGHMGTGFRFPSFDELNFLSDDLKPESALSYDLGVEQFFMKKKIKLGATWFKINVDDKINYSNDDESESDGIEASVSVKPWKWFKLGASYTYLENKIKMGESDWEKNMYQYLPRNKMNCYAVFYPFDGLTAHISFLWMDEIEEDWKKRLEDDPVIVNAALTYRLNDNAEIWMRAENIFDESYTRKFFSMPGQWIFGGIKFTF
ncbi:MAG: TonB-dependent receptor [Desulfobacteraceae bacterium]|nr:TonB-dependent receptor [Desulfobacteraceae bacterium]